MWHKFKSFLKILPKRKSLSACHGFGVSVITEVVIYLLIISERFPLDVGVFLKVAYILPFYKSFIGQREKRSSKSTWRRRKAGAATRWGGPVNSDQDTWSLITSLKSIPTFHFLLESPGIGLPILLLFHSKTFPLGLHLLEEWGAES